MWSLKVDETTNRSSKYTNMFFHCIRNHLIRKATHSVRWNAEPKRHARELIDRPICNVYDVFGLEEASRPIYHNASLKSIFDIQCTGGNLLRRPSKLGMGYASFFVISFTLRESKQKRSLPGLTINTAEDQARLGASSITPKLNLRSTSAHKRFSFAGDIG